MKLTAIALTTMLIGLQACTWVKPTEAGAQVRLVEDYNVTQCTKLGTTTTSVKHKIGAMGRDLEKVTEELTVLARNEAAVMGGDSIVAQGPPADGSMVFGVYRCRS